MARKPRLHVPGGLYHVILRGNQGQDLFFSRDDRQELYGLLADGVARFGHRIHAFCAMTNHVHLAAQVGETPLPPIVQNLAFRYTRWVNRRQRRMGHLFQGRYKAVVVDTDRYLLELIRYIHLNPVRAGIAAQPTDYPWSSHRAYLGQETLDWLSTDWVLAQFAPALHLARQRYRRFVAEGLAEGHREEFHRGAEDHRVLGDAPFLAVVLQRPRVQSPSQSLDTIEARVCQALEVPVDALAEAGRSRRAAEARGVIGWLARETAAAKLSDVAARYGRDPSTLTVAVRRVSERMRADAELAGRIRRLAS